MSAAPVKLPFAMRKAEKDLTPKKDAILAEMSEEFGSPIRFEHNLDVLYASVAGNSNAPKLVENLYETYMEAFQSFLRGLNPYIDPNGEVKKELLRHWTTGAITMVVEQKSDFTYKENAPLTTMGAYGSSGWRIVNGNLECWTRKDDFCRHMDAIADASVIDLLKNAPASSSAALPFELASAVTKTMKSAPYKENGVEKFEALTGKKIVYDLTADGLEYLANPNYKQLKSGYNPEWAAQYFESFVRLLELKFPDEMMKEGIMEKLSNNPVKFSVKLVKDVAAMEKVPNSVGDQYSRLQLQDGNVTVYQSTLHGYANAIYVHQHDVVPIL